MNRKLKERFLNLGFTFWVENNRILEEERQFNYFANNEILLILSVANNTNKKDLSKFFLSLEASFQYLDDPIIEVDSGFIPREAHHLLIFSDEPEGLLEVYRNDFTNLLVFSSIEQLWSSTKNKKQFFSGLNP